jgi:exopolysaccharide biosynthesis polyprenyl glycosylphosphotransferase
MVSEFDAAGRTSWTTKRWPDPGTRIDPPDGHDFGHVDGGGRAPAPGEEQVDRVSRPRWQTRYAQMIIVTDVALVVAVLAVAVAFGFGDPAADDHLGLLVAIGSAVSFIGWMVATRGWEPRVLGQGAEEFTRLLRSAGATAVGVGIVGLAFQLTATRPYVFGFIPLATAAVVGGRYVHRRGLYRMRSQGRCVLAVLAVGGEQAVEELVARTTRAQSHGWVVTAACTPGGTGTDGGDIRGVPVVGDLDSTAAKVLEGDYQVVAVSPADGWSPRRLHQLAWDLEGRGIELVVHPGLMEVTGPRLHVSPVDGLPLLRLTEPRFTGAARLLKAGMDKIGATLLLLILAPLLVAIFLAVRSDGGPAFYRQTRIGFGGRSFRMVKFRSMVVDAERLRTTLEAANDAAGPMFKVRADPRVTSLGALLRKYSLDELPQLFNVLTGSMSLVGPRPPLPQEVRGYSRDARRKFLVRPGLTGLWQISGRSDLSWEESVRLDLRYVENWTLALDGLILWKTMKAVVSGDGAY